MSLVERGIRVKVLVDGEWIDGEVIDADPKGRIHIGFLAGYECSVAPADEGKTWKRVERASPPAPSGTPKESRRG